MTIKEARKSVNLTQAKTSELTKIPLRTLQNWENGVRKCPEWCEQLVIEKILSLGTKQVFRYLRTNKNRRSNKYVTKGQNKNSRPQFKNDYQKDQYQI